jgi:diacylglycerol kinase family enzyme
MSAIEKTRYCSAGAEVEVNLRPDLSAPPLRPIALVFNNAAGALLARPGALDRARDFFAAADMKVEFVPESVGSLLERVEFAFRMEPAAVVVAGGDGTVASAAQVLANTNIPLGILPCGTMNLLAKDLGIPTDALEEGLRIVAAGAIREIDVAEVNGRVFLCASMLGLPTRVGRIREAQRRRSSGVLLWSRLGLASLRLLKRYIPRPLVLEANGRSRLVHASSITITANVVDEPGGRPLGRAHLDGGELGVYMIERLKFADVVRIALGWFFGTWRDDPTVREFRTGAVSLHGRRRAIRVMNDGEIMLLNPPLRYRIRPRALRVLVPPPAGAAGI